MDTSTDIREKIGNTINYYTGESVSLECMDKIIEVFKEYIEEKELLPGGLLWMYMTIFIHSSGQRLQN